MLKKKQKDSNPPEVNAGSMADIAFLLLIFFLVTTTIATDKGVKLTLPPWDENTEIEIKDRDVLMVQINFRNELLVEEEPLEMKDLQDKVMDHLTNIGKEGYPRTINTAIVSLKADRGTDYVAYLSVLDQVKAAYNKLRAKEVGLTLGEFLALNPAQKVKDRELYDKASEAYPMNISEAQPSEIKN